LKELLTKPFLTAFSIGVGVVIIVVIGVFYVQRGAHVELKGAILKVRTQALDENSSVAVIDFRFVNPSNYPFIVRSVEVSMQGPDGKSYDGDPVSEVDAKRIFQYYPLLGQKFNDTLLMRDKIAARQSQDRMIAARFVLPVKILEARQNLKVRVEDVDGPISEIAEK